jgi:hypothetical protein
MRLPADIFDTTEKRLVVSFCGCCCCNAAGGDARAALETGCASPTLLFDAPHPIKEFFSVI